MQIISIITCLLPVGIGSLNHLSWYIMALFDDVEILASFLFFKILFLDGSFIPCLDLASFYSLMALFIAIPVMALLLSFFFVFMALLIAITSNAIRYQKKSI